MKKKTFRKLIVLFLLWVAVIDCVRFAKFCMNWYEDYQIGVTMKEEEQLLGKL